MKKILIGLLFLSTGLSAQTFDFRCNLNSLDPAFHGLSSSWEMFLNYPTEHDFNVWFRNTEEGWANHTFIFADVLLTGEIEYTYNQNVVEDIDRGTQGRIGNRDDLDRLLAFGLNNFTETVGRWFEYNGSTSLRTRGNVDSFIIPDYIHINDADIITAYTETSTGVFIIDFYDEDFNSARRDSHNINGFLTVWNWRFNRPEDVLGSLKFQNNLHQGTGIESSIQTSRSLSITQPGINPIISYRLTRLRQVRNSEGSYATPIDLRFIIEDGYIPITQPEWYIE